MLQFLRRLRIITVGDVGWWHGRRRYPKDVHGISVPLHVSPSRKSSPAASSDDDNVTPIRPAGEANHG